MDSTKRAWLTRKECCIRLDMDMRLFRHYCDTAVFPQGVKRGPRAVVWSEEDVQWMVYREKMQRRFRRAKPPIAPKKTEPKP